jgi:hypothetical protein
VSDRHDLAADPVPGWTVGLLRALVIGTAVLIFAQPVTAGLFVTGDVGMLDLHALGHVLILFVLLAQIVAAVLVWRPGRGPAWPIWASVGLLVLTEIQAGFGFVRMLDLHFPGGVLLLGLAVAMVIGVWSPRLRVRRSAVRTKEAIG